MTTRPFAQRTLTSPHGPIEVAATGRGVVALALRTTSGAVAADIRRRLGREPGGDDATGETAIDASSQDPGSARRWVSAACTQLEAYLAGSRVAFDVPVDLAGLSAWDRRVLEGVRRIPFGHTLGYGELARAVGSPGAARAAGGSVGRNPLAILIPCHRVIAGDGTLGGYGGAWPADRDELLELKAALLAHEGLGVPRTSHAA